MFLLIGLVGVAILILTLVFDDVLEGLFPDTGWLSMTGVAAFLAAFGFVGWLLDGQAGAPVPLAAAGGTVAGFGLGYLAVRSSRALSSMATDATPTAADLVGCSGRVVTPIPAHSTGEVLIRLGGQPVKLTAVAGADQSGELGTGSDVMVVRVISSTRVEVQAAADFWGGPTDPPTSAA